MPSGSAAAAAPGTGTAGPLRPAAGSLLGGRYRLLRPVRSGPLSWLWQAEDEVLARPVALRVLGDTPGAQARAAAFLSAAVRAGRATGPGIASVYDAAEEPAAHDAAVVRYVVAAWVAGPSLAEVLRDGPLASAEAAALTRSLCDALEGVHSAGVSAGRLHPGQVLLTTAGTVRLTDLEVSAALHGQAPSPDPVRADTDDAARVLYAAVTGCWPTDAGRSRDWSGLPAAPVRDGRLCLPRQVRAGVPRELDTVVARVLEPLRRPTEPALRTPAALAAALAPLAAAPREASDAGDRAATRRPRRDHPEASGEDEDQESPVPLRRRRGFRLAVVLLLLTLVGAGGWATGLTTGRVPTTEAPRRVPGTATGRGAPAAGPLDIAAASAFDPVGKDGENDNYVPDAYDSDPTTYWRTEFYASASLGNLKPGVGLLIDLGKAQPVDRVVLDVPAGETLALYAAAPAVSTPPTGLDGLTPATPPTPAAGSGETTLRPTAATSARFWVLWLTQLPAAPDPGPGGGFQGRITEFAFYSAR